MIHRVSFLNTRKERTCFSNPVQTSLSELTKPVHSHNQWSNPHEQKNTGKEAQTTSKVKQLQVYLQSVDCLVSRALEAEEHPYKVKWAVKTSLKIANLPV
jgi:hypothetical protein